MEGHKEYDEYFEAFEIKGENKMDKYMGFKLVDAEPAIKMANGDIYSSIADIPVKQRGVNFDWGYQVIYADGYKSWSPTGVFEASHLLLKGNAELPSGVSIDIQLVNNFIKELHTETIGEKTTLVRAVLANGFEIIETSSCVDKANYDETMGKEICLERIQNKIWELLGFLLQTAYKGVK